MMSTKLPDIYIENNKEYMFGYKFLDRMKLLYKKKYCVLVHMQLETGGMISFIAIVKDGFFVWKKGRYIVNDESLQYNYTAKLYQGYYHENCALPVMHRISLSKVRKQASSAECENVIEPKVLTKRMETNMAMQIMQATKFDEWVKRVMFTMVIVAIITAVNLIISLNEAGVFSKVT